MKIRTATTADLPRLADVWQEHMVILGQADPRFAGREQNREQWISKTTCRINARDCMVFVAQVGDDLAGYIAACARADHCGVVDELALDAHTYHGGLGRGLWSALRIWFAERDGVEQILIHVPRYDVVGQAFWRALGATERTDDTCPPEMTWLTL